MNDMVYLYGLLRSGYVTTVYGCSVNIGFYFLVIKRYFLFSALHVMNFIFRARRKRQKKLKPSQKLKRNFSISHFYTYKKKL